jgi:hypothetical protein
MCIDSTKTVWNSLEIIKVIISGLTPIIVAYLAFRFNRVIKKYEKVQWTNQKIIEKRIAIYDIIVPKLNDLLCYYCYIGDWKEITPKGIIETKRFLDKQVYIYAPLFSNDVLNKYNALIDVCFEKFTGWGKDAKINSFYERRKECQDNWIEDWNDCFSDSYINERKGKDQLVKQDITNIRNLYLDLMEELKNNLEIYKTGIYHQSDFPSINFK